MGYECIHEEPSIGSGVNARPVAIRAVIAELSVTALVLLRRLAPEPPVVCYGSLPRYMRVLRRLLRVPESRIAAWLAKLCGVRLERVPERDEVAGFPALHFDGGVAVAEICEALLPTIEADPYTGVLADLIGSEPALAHIVMDIAHCDLWPSIFALAATAGRFKQPLLFVPPPAWPDECCRRVRERLSNHEFTIFGWPRWARSLWKACSAANWPARVLAVFLPELLRRGLRPVRRELQKCVLMTEYVDPDRLNGHASDADFWVGENGVPIGDTLFYLTGAQKRFMERHGRDRDALLRPIRQKSYRLASLDELPYSTSVPGNAVRLLCRGACAAARSTWLSGSVLRAWAAYLEHEPLFANYAAQSILSTRNPNGHASWRLDRAVLTGLARQHGVRSIGLQNRIYYGAIYEFYFECFDIMLVWGAAWYEQLNGGRRFLGRTLDVGCISLDSLIPARTALPPGRPSERVSVVVFPAEPAGVHYNLSYGRSFLGAVARLAFRHPECDFKVKCKDPQDAQVFLRDGHLRDLVSGASNFSFIEMNRHEYVPLLVSADIVLAIGFTTPGTEALLLGKRTIYYSELDEGETAISGVPGLIAHSEEDFNRLFDQAIARGGLTHDQRLALDALDPFRDGQARARVVRHLLPLQAPGKVPEPVDAAVAAREIHQGAGAS